ncbi:hypothetical protein GWI33_008961 [Rhynchophorus ferrugineus]|uniref:Uncharacterized protein n=1 Tax=Rhynchophorus ferrugineus TaxID=354439 RepID=A0A834MG89_RHYFE|nr:hypothetical protein GWI33_008961 [Rhynchophorus ferrugineus]
MNSQENRRSVPFNKGRRKKKRVGEKTRFSIFFLPSGRGFVTGVNKADFRSRTGARNRSGMSGKEEKTEDFYRI